MSSEHTPLLHTRGYMGGGLQLAAASPCIYIHWT